jgi:hypothetical protein
VAVEVQIAHFKPDYQGVLVAVVRVVASIIRMPGGMVLLVRDLGVEMD